MKKRFSWLVALILLVVLVPIRASAAQTGSCGEHVTWSLDGDTLTISGEGSTADYSTSESAPWYRDRMQIRRIVVE